MRRVRRGKAMGGGRLRSETGARDLGRRNCHRATKFGLKVCLAKAPVLAWFFSGCRARSAHKRARSALKGLFSQFLASPCFLEGLSITVSMCSNRYWTVGQISKPILCALHAQSRTKHAKTPLFAISGFPLHFLGLKHKSNYL